MFQLPQQDDNFAAGQWDTVARNPIILTSKCTDLTLFELSIDHIYTFYIYTFYTFSAQKDIVVST